VVDGISETEAVLKAVLEPQGARVERCRSSECLAIDPSPPRVVVVDADDASSELAFAPLWPDVPRVVLGSARVDGSESAGRFLEKPFHYPELIHLVESLLDLPTERRRVG
jgi:CheY-like chemotaxis protein